MSTGRPQIAPLYRRLPHGPNGMSREEVARNQRTRIFGAMIEAVDQRGYHGTSVADVIALAGVSRRAFYELFPNKQDCFLATHDVVVANARRGMIEAWRAEHGFSARLHASCATLLDGVAARPDGARLALLEAPAAGPPARERLQLAAISFEQLVVGAFRGAPDGARLPPLAVRAIAGGVREVVARRLRSGSEQELPGLNVEVLDWAMAYATPLVPRLAALRAQPRPRIADAGEPAGFLLDADARTRALEALALLTLERGYATVADGEIARRAGLSTEAFHREFASKEACYLALVDHFAVEAGSAARAAGASARSWTGRVRATLAGLLAYLLDHMGLVRIALVDAFDVGIAATRRLERTFDRLVDLVTAQAPPPRSGAPIARPALAGALLAILASCTAGDRLARLASIVDQLAFVVLAPYIGARAAIAALAERSTAS